jgi:cytoskeletal protein RodZ
MTTPIHEQLRFSREALGFSVEDVAHETRIPSARIKLIEEGKFAAIGSMAYARNFLLTYSRFLGVDVQDTLDTLPKPIFAATESYGYLREPVCAWVADDKKSLSAFSAPTLRKRKPVTSPLAKAVALVFFTGILAAWWGHQVVTARTASALTQAEAVTKPVAMAATPTLNSFVAKPAQPAAASIPWADVNRTAVRRAEVVPDDEDIEVKKTSVASASQEGL